MNKKIFIWIIVLIVLILGGYYLFKNYTPSVPANVQNTASSSDEKVNLVYAVHWALKDQTDGIYKNGVLKSKGLKQYLDEYTKLYPNVEFTVKVIPYGEYADTLQVLSDADLAPDIYQIYSPWGVSYVKNGILDTPPQDIKDDVMKNYISTAGVNINGEIWGIPTEINTNALLYNKDLFKEAGIATYPRTWDEFVNDAVKLTKRDSKGNIIQYGVAFLNEDWQVVDPFLSILFSNGGKYLSSDLKKSLFNSTEGVEALNAELSLFKKGATDTNGNFFDFGKGTVGMVIAPPWVKATFAGNFGDKFESTVGVATFPVFNKPATMSYSWFMGVMGKSKNKEAAWNFLKWFSTDVQSSGTTRYGDLLAENIGAIPSRKIDFESHKDVLGDFFTKIYVDEMKNTVAEPNVLESNNIKATLMKEIQAAWAGKKTAKEALDSAAIEVDKILERQ
jgi:multiple sugar transport system substrate-binding protein